MERSKMDIDVDKALEVLNRRKQKNDPVAVKSSQESKLKILKISELPEMKAKFKEQEERREATIKRRKEEQKRRKPRGVKQVDFKKNLWGYDVKGMDLSIGNLAERAENFEQKK